MGIHKGSYLSEVSETPHMGFGGKCQDIASAAIRRYLISNDPLGRSIARQMPSGEISVTKLWENGEKIFNFGISPGEVVLHPGLTPLLTPYRNGLILRETRYNSSLSSVSDKGLAVYDIVAERIEKIRQVRIGYDYTSGMHYEERYYRDRITRIYYCNEIPMYSMVLGPDGKEYKYSYYNIRSYLEDGDLYITTEEIQVNKSLRDFIKYRLDRNNEGKYRNWQRVWYGNRWRDETARYPSSITPRDFPGNSVLYRIPKMILRALVKWNILGGKQLENLVTHRDGDIIYTGDQINHGYHDLEPHKGKVDTSTRSSLLYLFGRLAAIALAGAGLLLVFSRFIPSAVNIIYARRRRSKLEVNSAAESDLIDMDFTKAQAQSVIRERCQNGPFADYRDLITRMGWGAKKYEEIFVMYAPLSGHKFRRRSQIRKLSNAIVNSTHFKYVSESADVFTAADLSNLRIEAEGDLAGFFRELWRIYNSAPEKEASRKSIEQMFMKYLKQQDFVLVIASQEVKRLVERVSKSQAVEVIIRRLYARVREDRDWRSEIEERVDRLIAAFGLRNQPGFSDQNNILRKTFLDNIYKARLLPEGFTLANDDIVSDLALYSFDDLRKTPPLNRRITADLVSLERLFVMQVLLQRGLASLIGQGRIEDYLWQRFLRARMQQFVRGADSKLNDILGMITFVRDSFALVLLNQEIRERLEQNRDPQGRVLNYQAIITEEVFNDALRYVLGLKDPDPQDTGWLLKEETRQAIALLGKKFDQLFQEFVVEYQRAGTEAEKETAYRSYAQQIKPVIQAIVHLVESREGITIVKHRLSYWELNVKPALKILFDSRIRRAVFSKGGPYNRTRSDLLRRIYNFAVIGLISGLFAYLIVNAVNITGYLGVATILQFPLGLAVAVAAAVLVIALWPLYLKLIRGALERRIKGINSSSQIEQAKQERISQAVKIYKRRLMIGCIANLVFFLAALFVVPQFLGQQLFMVTLPDFAVTMSKVLPWLLFVATWRLSFPAVNYFGQGLAELGHNWRNNIYEITKNRNLGQMEDRLVELFSDQTSGYLGAGKARGEERIASFNILLRHLSGAEEYYFALPEGTHIDPVRQRIRKVLDLATRKIIVSGCKVSKPQYYAIQQIREWINDEYRTDKADQPRSWDEILPMTISQQGYGEDLYFPFAGAKKTLFNHEKGRDETELTHRLGSLAKYRREAFLLMVARLTSEGSLERDELLAVIKDPKYQPKDPTSWKNWKEIERWANNHLPTTWANARTTKRVNRDILRYYAEHFGVTDIDEEVEAKIRVIPRHLKGLRDVNKKLGGNLRALFDQLYINGYNRAAVPGLSDEAIEEAYAGGDELASRYILELMIEEGLWPAFTIGYPTYEEYHRAKWNQLTASLPFIIGPVLLLLDADHRSNFAGSRLTFDHLMEYYYNPGLGASIPVINHTLTKDFGTVGPVVPVAENAFYFHTQSGKMLFGGLGAYGKFFVR
ncbi:hypothetical protein ACFL1K_05775, partial [Candidatus Omnitrophota bacterium]